MIISIDYDDTYTKDRYTWNKVIEILREAGHTVYCVTLRYVQETLEVYYDLDGLVDGIYATGRKNKKDFMLDLGIWVDVWCDDNPFFILNDAAK